MQKVINGTLVTCDRCGKKRFIRGKLANYGWRDVFEMDICPVCAKKLDELVTEFMKNEENDVFDKMIADVLNKNEWEECTND